MVTTTLRSEYLGSNNIFPVGGSFLQHMSCLCQYEYRCTVFSKPACCILFLNLFLTKFITGDIPSALFNPKELLGPLGTHTQECWHTY